MKLGAGIAVMLWTLLFVGFALAVGGQSRYGQVLDPLRLEALILWSLGAIIFANIGASFDRMVDLRVGLANGAIVGLLLGVWWVTTTALVTLWDGRPNQFSIDRLADWVQVVATFALLAMAGAALGGLIGFLAEGNYFSRYRRYG